MGSTTPRLGLYKAAAVGEQVNVETQVNAAFDKIDLTAGLQTVTSGTRPATPFRGQLIEETDTGRILRWNGSSWRDTVFGEMFQTIAPAAQTIPNNIFAAVGYPSPATKNDAPWLYTLEGGGTGAIIFSVAGRYLVTCRVAWDAVSTGRRILLFSKSTTTTGSVNGAAGWQPASLITLVEPPTSSGETMQVLTAQVDMLAGEKLYAYVFQDSAGGINIIQGDGTNFQGPSNITITRIG